MPKRCFKISGNFRQYGGWSTPDPGFIGYIIVDDEGVFEGYMEEQYATRDPLRFVTGIFDEKYATKLAYYELTASGQDTPLLFIFPDILKLGQFFVIDKDEYNKGGEAKVSLGLYTVDRGMLKRIQEIKKRIVGNGPVWNKDLASKASELRGSL